MARILTPEQCLRDAAGQWASCMEANGITIKARSTRKATPKPTRIVKKKASTRTRA